MEDSKKPNRTLSISGYRKYHTCPKIYDNHYNLKDRPNSTTSALIVGVTFDEACNNILLGNEFSQDEVNKKIDEMISVGKCSFYPVDFDDDYTLPEDVKYAEDLGWTGTDFKTLIVELIAKQDTITDNQYKLLVQVITSQMKTKIKIMIDSYIKWILPRVEGVIDVQQGIAIELEGWTLNGFADFTAVILNENGKKIRVLLDNKTTTRAYKNEAVKYNPQLILYAEALGFDNVGFITISKNISKNKVQTCVECDHQPASALTKKCNNKIDSKRCNGKLDVVINPSAYIQLMTESVTKYKKKLVIDSLCDTIKLIETGIFPRNLDACGAVYGKPCQYFNKCWKGE